MTPAEILDGAADLIEVGWTRGVYHRVRNGKDCYCVKGAMAQVWFGDPNMGFKLDWDPGAARDATYALRCEVGEGSAAWNDEMAKSKYEVIRTLRKVAAGLREAA